MNIGLSKVSERGSIKATVGLSTNRITVLS